MVSDCVIIFRQDCALNQYSRVFYVHFKKEHVKRKFIIYYVFSGNSISAQNNIELIILKEIVPKEIVFKEIILKSRSYHTFS